MWRSQWFKRLFVSPRMILRTTSIWTAAPCTSVAILAHTSRARTQHDAVPPKPGPVTYSRIMSVVDTNLAGNVHGGTILDMIEAAGHIAASRHAQSPEATGILAALTDSKAHGLLVLARLERVDFLQPMHVGELAQLEAKVVGVGKHSVEVVVDVRAENLSTGEVRRTNQARLWYVHVDCSSSRGEKRRILPVPKLSQTPAEEAAARARYAEQKSSHLTKKTFSAVDWQSDKYPSEVSLSLLFTPNDCVGREHNPSQMVRGGPVMKLMDNAAGIVAFRHARTNVVTACIDACDLVAPIQLSDVVRVSARPVFASARSLEIEVVVEAENLKTGEKQVTTRSLMTFVSLGKDGKPLTIPALFPTTDAQKKRFHEGEKRYMERKARVAEERARGLPSKVQP